MENLPVTGAFTEAAVAVRALIRHQRKKGLDGGSWLQLLYWLAAVASFSIPYSTVLQEPGFNVMETIPGEVIHGLRFSYRELGHKHLSLLNKTDIKWLEKAWGEPTSHTTLHELHKDVWGEYETRLYLKREAERAQFIERLAALLSDTSE